MANNKGYKRSWKNYLLDSNYQLRFTFTMLAIAAGLMAPLGWWVSQKSTTATEVALNKIDEIDCPDLLVAKPAEAPNAVENPGEEGEETDLLQEGAPVATPPAERDEIRPAEVEDEVPTIEDIEQGTAEGSDEPIIEGSEEGNADASADDAHGDGERERPAIKVTIDDSNMPTTPVVVVGELKAAPPSAEEVAHAKAARDACLANVAARKTSVRARRSLITEVMVTSAVFLLVLLGFYGIKTTHRVAGPLHKVGLYLKKLENNVYDQVYNLRKGDQLIEFYDHFKGAHEGLTKLQEEDRERLKDAIALAKEAGLVDKSKEMAALLPELERLLAEKEESFVKKQA